jgi:hypothetical protein
MQRKTKAMKGNKNDKRYGKAPPPSPYLVVWPEGPQDKFLNNSIIDFDVK